MPDPKPVIDRRRTLLALVEGSVGGRTWRHLYATTESGPIDLLEDGALACSYFVSSILLTAGLIKEMHATVAGCLKDLETFGWKETPRPKAGAIVVWEPQIEGDASHAHIGFYINERTAISNSTHRRSPRRHALSFRGRRAVTGFWTHPDIDK